MIPFIIFLVAAVLFVAFVIYSSVKVVKQTEVYVIERLGKFHKIADAGLTIIIPFIDRVSFIVSLKQQTLQKIMLQSKLTQLYSIRLQIQQELFMKFNL